MTTLRTMAAAALLVAGWMGSSPARAEQHPFPDGGAAVCALVNPCGDVDGSGTVATTDALIVLRTAVGQNVAIQCEVEGDGGGSSLLRTGVTKCYAGNGTEVDCIGSGQDGESKSGVALAYTDNGNGTITDDKTGLVWEKLDDANLDGDAGIHDKDRTYSWINTQEKVATFNAFSFGGHSDWRVPNIRELQSLLNFGRAEPAIATIFDDDCTPGCKSTDCSCTSSSTSYWTSTPYHDVPSHSWAVYFLDGQITAQNRTVAFHVRLVAGGS